MIRCLPFFLIFLLGCETKNDSPSSYNEDKFVAVLKELHFAEAAIENLPPLEKDSVGIQHYVRVLRTHKMTKEELEEIMGYLRYEPEALNRIYNKLYLELDQEL
jgi:hypothetical protein